MAKIKVGDPVTISSYPDGPPTQSGIVLATNVMQAPDSSAPNGIYEFDRPRFAIQVENLIDQNGKKKPHHNAGGISYPSMHANLVKRIQS